MLLKDKVAVIYGAGGPIGGAIARAFAAEGARLFLSGRTLSKVDALAESLRSSAVTVESAEIDATDEHAVYEYVDTVITQAGSLDISVNVISLHDVQQPLTEISLDDFLSPITTAMRTHFLTTRAAAQQMKQQHSGVILAFGGSGPQTQPGLGGFKIALDAMEGLRRQWALELGEYGIRVVTIKTGGIPESLSPDFEYKDVITEAIEGATLLKRAATLDDVGKVAAFLASDHARTITSTEVNISAGSIVD